MIESSSLILEKLNNALQADSDFPTRAKIITELKRVTSDINTPIDVIVDIILTEPSLSSRLLHLTNSVYFGRGLEITTLSKAVAQLGLKGVYNLCANFVLLQKFSGLSEKSSSFSNCFLMSLLTSNIASFIDSHEKSTQKDEESFLAGSLFSLGPLLLGFYFPKLFSEAEKRAERKNITVLDGIEELLGIAAVGISVKVVDSLAVPQAYKEILVEAYDLYSNNFNGPLSSLKSSSKSVCLASILAEIIVYSNSAKEIKEKLLTLSDESNITYPMLCEYLKKLPSVIDAQKGLLDSAACSFSEAFVKFLKGDFDEESNEKRGEDGLSPYLSQIENAIVESETLPSIIATVMEALSFACEFDRVIYFESNVNKTELQGKSGLGDNIPDVSGITYKINDPKAGEETIELKAYYSGMVETHGKPLFPDAWPYVAIPVGYEERSLGVIYADKIAIEKNNLNSIDSLTLTLLSDLLDRALIKNQL